MATAKIYDGSSWVSSIPKVWDGSAWQEKMKFWDGSSWVDLFAISGTITVGIDGFGGSGYDDEGITTFGSVSPDPFALYGETVIVIDSRLGNHDLRVCVSGSAPSSLFATISVEDHNGNILDFDTSSASFTSSNGDGNAEWTWGAGNSGDLVWIAGDDGNVRSVTFS